MKIIHLTFDLDNDFFEKSFSQKSTLNNKWDGFRIGVPKIFEIINKFEKNIIQKLNLLGLLGLIKILRMNLEMLVIF